jgi:hypothetical protein
VHSPISSPQSSSVPGEHRQAIFNLGREGCRVLAPNVLRCRRQKQGDRAPRAPETGRRSFVSDKRPWQRQVQKFPISKSKFCSSLMVGARIPTPQKHAIMDTLSRSQMSLSGCGSQNLLHTTEAPNYGHTVRVVSAFARMEMPPFVTYGYNYLHCLGPRETLKVLQRMLPHAAYHYAPS